MTVQRPTIESTRAPCGKVAYISRAEAKRALRNIRENAERIKKQKKSAYRESVNRKEDRSYQCDRCGFWHLTSQKNYKFSPKKEKMKYDYS